jgi:hypothetical protein
MKSPVASKVVLIFTLCMILGFGNSGPAFAMGDKRDANAPCEYPTKIRIDKYLFEIPKFSGSRFTPEHIEPHVCGQILDDTGFTFRPTSFFTYKENNPYPGTGSYVTQIIIRKRNPNDPIQDNFLRGEIEKKLKEQGKSLKDLPAKNGFYEFEYKPRHYYYMAVNKDLKTPLGNPVVIACTKHLKSDQTKVPPYSIKCGISFDLNADLIADVSGWSPNIILPEDWEEFFPYVINYIKELESTGTL